jgi:hypothetical protein
MSENSKNEKATVLDSNKLKRDDIEKTIENFLSLKGVDEKDFSKHRYSSFDYCYNYFCNNKGKLANDMEKSCLTLAFYLASWGMYRGSSSILQKSVKHFEPLIEDIEKIHSKDKDLFAELKIDNDTDLWKIDVDNYDDKNIKTLIHLYDHIETILGKSKKGKDASVTLVTKIMLGVFGTVPAYDRLFQDSFSDISGRDCCFTSFNDDSLNTIKAFYEVNKDVIDKLADETYTYDFRTGEKTKRQYTKAKIIDMYGFQLSIDKKRRKAQI